MWAVRVATRTTTSFSAHSPPVCLIALLTAQGTYWRRIPISVASQVAGLQCVCVREWPRTVPQRPTGSRHEVDGHILPRIDHQHSLPRINQLVFWGHRGFAKAPSCEGPFPLSFGLQFWLRVRPPCNRFHHLAGICRPCGFCRSRCCVVLEFWCLQCTIVPVCLWLELH